MNSTVSSCPTSSFVSVETKKEKIFYIELLRAVSCFAVILLHTVNNVITNTEIYGTNTWNIANFINSISRFTVPIFLMISGFFSLNSKKNESVTAFLKKKFKRLFVPLVIYSALYYVAETLMSRGKFSVFNFLFRFITMDIHYHLWFLYTLLSIEIFTPLFKTVVQNIDRKKLWYFFIITILPTTICPLINKITGVWLFRFEPVILGYFGYFLLGYIIGTADISKRNRTFIYISGFFAILASYFGTKMLSSLQEIDVFFNGGYQFNSYLIATSIFVFAKYNLNKCNNTFFNRLVIKLGNLAFGIYLIHALVLEFLIHITNAGHIFTLVLLSIPTFIISALISYIIQESRKPHA